ncbi:glycoside hydrolase domain-containing protein [Streptomyces mesophilus]|uniref:glycoside hydrolase domain-containing protein n=1 Tax=Streptomyces mesophilus TaxID=1775132 RepID=UPI00332304DA
MRTPKLIIGLLVLVALTTLTAPSAAVPTPEHRGAARGKVFRGWAFDTCTTPPLRTMSAWRKSNFRGVAVYFGGRGRFCKKQPHLSASWLRQVDRMGWSVLPVYVGSQSPCVLVPHKKKVRIGRDAWGQGRKEGLDAVRRAKAYGMKRGSALYLDIENYSMAKWQCRKPTLTFVRGWNRAVRGQGYVPGFYSSLSSGIWHMERARKAGYGDLPGALWYARWNGKPRAHPIPGVSPQAWRGASIHQYRGPKKEKYGGHAMEVDRNLVNAPVAVLR